MAGFDPSTAVPANAPTAPSGGGFDPSSAQPAVSFSDKAIMRAVGRPGAQTVYMSPKEYLALTPDIPDNSKNDKKAKALKASLQGGDEIEEVPSLEVVVDKDGKARVTDQDGRHRAQAAMDAGLDQIPVAVQRFGTKAPISHLVGMRDGSEPVPFDFKPVALPASTKPSEAKPAPVKRPATATDYALSVGQGIGDPIAGTAQLGSHAIGTLLKAPTLGSNPASQAFDRDVTEPLDAFIARENKNYEARRAATGRSGLDIPRTLGDIVSPINYVPLGKLSKLGDAAVLAKRAEPVFQGTLRWLARNAASTGAPAAVISALNPVSGGDFWSDKTKQAAFGLLAGTFVPPILKVGASVLMKAGTAAVAPIMRWMSNIHSADPALDAAKQTILHRLSQGASGGGPTAQEMLALAARTPGKPLTLMDVGGKPVRALAGRMARTPGAPGQIIDDALGGRVTSQGQRLEGDVDTHVAKGTAHDTIVAMQQSRANAAAPLYEKAFAENQNISSPVINRILQTPAGRAALSAARVKMQNDMTLMGVPDKELMEQAREAAQRIPGGKGVASGLKLRTLDYVKRSLDDMIGSAQRAGERDNARILTGLKSDFVKALDDADITGRAGPNSTKPEGGLYRQARAAYSGPSQSIDAVEFGHGALKPSISAAETAAHFAKLNPNDQEFARMGLATAIRQYVASRDVGNNAARSLARNPAMQSRIRPFFKDNADYEKFMASVTAEDIMFKTSNEVLGNSKTAERAAEDRSQEASALGHAANASIDFAHGNHIRGLRSLGRALSDYAQRPNAEVGENIARLLSEPFNQQNGGAGMRLLRDFAAVAPHTRNYFSQAHNRTLRQLAAPIGALAGQAVNP